MYASGPQHSITGGGSPPVYSSGGGGGGEIPPHFARIDAYGTMYQFNILGISLWFHIS